MKPTTLEIFRLYLKNVKKTKQSHSYKGYASTDNANILNSFNPGLQLKNTESAIKNKLKKILLELTELKFVTTMTFEFNKIE